MVSIDCYISSLLHVLQALHKFEILCYSPRSKMQNTLYHQYRPGLCHALYQKCEINYKKDILLQFLSQIVKRNRIIRYLESIF